MALPHYTSHISVSNDLIFIRNSLHLKPVSGKVGVLGKVLGLLGDLGGTVLCSEAHC